MGAWWSKVEAKVKAAGLGALIASLAAALINALLNGSVIPATPHAWVQFGLITLGPPVVAFASGWAARHTSIPPVVPPRLPTTVITGPGLK
jgi:hypothetical protein